MNSLKLRLVHEPFDQLNVAVYKPLWYIQNVLLFTEQRKAQLTHKAKHCADKLATGTDTATRYQQEIITKKIITKKLSLKVIS